VGVERADITPKKAWGGKSMAEMLNIDMYLTSIIREAG
jgi:hypothetical protein